MADTRVQPPRSATPVTRTYSDDVHRSPGVVPRKHRLESDAILAEEKWRRQGLSDEEIEARLNAEFRSPETRDPRFRKKWDQLAPTSTTFPRREAIPLVEAAAVLRIPLVAWLYQWFATHDAPGPQPSGIGAAVAFSLALEGGPPNFNSRMKLFRHADALRGFAYDYPNVTEKTSAYEQWHKACARREPDAAVHVSLALIRQLAALVDDPEDKKRPRVGQYLIVDGTQQQADVRQVFPVNEKHARFLDQDYEGLGYVRYARRDGRELKRNHGYNVVVISDMATSLPLVWMPYPAGYDERRAAEELLQMLFYVWPECPAEYLVGDALYDHSNQFSRDLEHLWNLHPVFPPHGSRSDSASEFAETDGVPTCPHSATGYMKLQKAENFFNGLHGVEKGSPRGEEPPNRSAFNRWVCPADICQPINVQFGKDPRRNSYLPQRGDHDRRYLRAALLPRRNTAESVFASIQALALFGPGISRARCAKTHREAMWTFGLAFLGLVAKRLAHEAGLYGETLERVHSLDLLTPPSIDEPSPGPDHQQLAVIRELDPQELNPPDSFEMR